MKLNPFRSSMNLVSDAKVLARIPMPRLKGAVHTLGFWIFSVDLRDAIVISGSPRLCIPWLAELLLAQPEYRLLNEPLHLGNRRVCEDRVEEGRLYVAPDTSGTDGIPLPCNRTAGAGPEAAAGRMPDHMVGARGGPLLRRSTPAGGHRADALSQPAGDGDGRGHRQPRQRDGALHHGDRQAAAQEADAYHHRHRLPTVRSRDRFFFLAEGRLDVVGTYDELLETSDGFQAMASA